MTFIIMRMESNKIIHQYSDLANKNIRQLFKDIDSRKFENGVTEKGFRKIIEESGNRFYYQLEDVKNNKNGKFQVKIIHDAVTKTFSYFKYNDDLTNKIKEISIHNTRNIHNSILERLKTSFSYKELTNSDNKLFYIKEIINKDSDKSAKVLLSTLKSLEQVTFEYDVIDFINHGRSLSEKDLTINKIHTLLVLVYYIYEHDLAKRNIQVKIDNNFDTINVNFSIFRSALSLIFENCLKYAKENTEIIIDYSIIKGVSYKIDIEMESIYNDEEDLKELFLPYFRSKTAVKIFPNNGEGLGLYVANKLLELNGIELDFKIIRRNNKNLHKGVEYSNNMFVLSLPVERINI